MHTVLLIAALMGAFLGVHPLGITHAQGSSNAAHACQQGDYLTLQGSDGTTA